MFHMWEDDEPSNNCCCSSNNVNRLTQELQMVRRELQECKEKNSNLIIEFMALLNKNEELTNLLYKKQNKGT
jgi:vacuolar-type H+-ATPase subunit D/Vma8